MAIIRLAEGELAGLRLEVEHGDEELLRVTLSRTSSIERRLCDG